MEKNGCSIMLDGCWWTFWLIVQREQCLWNLLMLLRWLRQEKMFELLDKWMEQFSEENMIQVITDDDSSYMMTGKTYYLNFLSYFFKSKLFILELIWIQTISFLLSRPHSKYLKSTFFLLNLLFQYLTLTFFWVFQSS